MNTRRPRHGAAANRVIRVAIRRNGPSPAGRSPEEPEADPAAPPENGADPAPAEARQEQGGFGQYWVDIAPAIADRLGLDEAPAAMVREWSWVLLALRVPHRVEQRRDAPLPVVLAPPRFADYAVEEVAEYAAEPRESATHEPDPPAFDNARSTVAAMLLLALLHAMRDMHVYIPGAGYSDFIDWVRLGGNSAADVLSGEWWRTVTALTLHGDAAHLVGNMAIGGCFLVILCRELGAGAGWTLAVLSGIVGNVLNIHFQGWGHNSIGFSTAVFGAVGSLGGLRALRGYGLSVRKVFLPVAGSLMFLAFLGMGGADPSGVDIGAHVFGLLAGLALGGAAGLAVNRWGLPGPLLNAGLGLATALVVAAAWVIALAHK